MPNSSITKNLARNTRIKAAMRTEPIGGL